MAESWLDWLPAAEAALGLRFHRRDLLLRALVHRSYLNENPAFTLGSNERLEFLGDAVLGFVVAEHLYHAFPERPEGDLTTLRAWLVREETLARSAERLGLGPLLLLGRGEATSGGRSRPSVLSSAFEALVGALFLDQGLAAAERFIRETLAPDLALAAGGEALAPDFLRFLKDDKSLLQELAQAETGLTPTYHTVETLGPGHARTFTVVARLGERTLAEGRGRSKQEAEQEAARVALDAWPSRAPAAVPAGPVAPTAAGALSPNAAPSDTSTAAPDAAAATPDDAPGEAA